MLRRADMDKTAANAAILATRPQQAQPSPMTDRPQDENARKSRLAAALRDNLKRRKAQERARKQHQAVIETPSRRSAKSHDSAGIVEDK